MAWVDLIDQLEQPQKVVTLPTKDEVPEAATQSGTRLVHRESDEEISEDDEALDDEASVDITSALYKAKVSSRGGGLECAALRSHLSVGLW